MDRGPHARGAEQAGSVEVVRARLALSCLETEKTLRACVSLGRRCGFDEGHSRQDAILALRLFDQLEGSFDLAVGTRDLLEYAALLHDIGYVEGYEGHHKTAYRLIMEASLPGLTSREKRLVANIARYHRGATPNERHSGFASLDDEDRAAAQLLGAILRLADGLDRTHGAAVRGVDLRREGNLLIVLLDCPSGCEAERWAGEKKGRVLGELLGLRVEAQVLPQCRGIESTRFG